MGVGVDVIVVGLAGVLIGWVVAVGWSRWAGRVVGAGDGGTQFRASVVGLDEAERIAQQGSWAWDLCTGRVQWSHQMFVLLDVDPDEFRPTLRNYLGLVIAEDEPALREAVQEAVREGTPFELRYRMRRGDGQVRLFESRGRVIDTLDDGGPRRLAGTCRDVTEEVARVSALDGQRRRLQALTRRLTAVQEQERRRVGLALHDDVGQIVTALELQFARHASVCDGSGVEDIAEELRRLHERVRNLSIELRPRMLDDLGLAHAVRWLVERADGPSSTSVVLRADGVGRRRHAVEVETSAYRIVQEALTNAMRHAEAGEVTVTLDDDGSRLQVEISDDGVGFDPDAVPDTASGISGMHERAEAIHGRLEVRSHPARGTTVVAQLPSGGPLPTQREEVE